MRTSGQIVDFYDDSEKSEFRTLFPTLDSVPELIKEAHILSEDELQKLPDNMFALVMHNNGNTMRKFACATPSDVVLSTLYFVKNAHKLPLEAQKTAAQNLLIACDWYGLDKPEQLQKAAMVGQALGMMSAASNIGDVVGGIKKPATAIAGVKAPGT